MSKYIGDDLGHNLGKLLWVNLDSRILAMECSDEYCIETMFVYLKLNDNKLWW